jgi:hypothetical protein
MDIAVATAIPSATPVVTQTQGSGIIDVFTGVTKSGYTIESTVSWFLGQLDQTTKSMVIVGGVIFGLLVVVGFIIAIRSILKGLFDWGPGHQDENLENNGSVKPSEEEQLRRVRLFTEFTSELRKNLEKEFEARNAAFENVMIYVEGELNIVKQTIEASFQRIIANKLGISFDEAFQRQSLILFRQISQGSRSEIVQTIRMILKKNGVQDEGIQEFSTRRVEILVPIYLKPFTQIQTLGDNTTYADIRLCVESLRYDFIEHFKKVVEKHDQNKLALSKEQERLDSLLKKHHEDVVSVLKG